MFDWTDNVALLVGTIVFILAIMFAYSVGDNEFNVLDKIVESNYSREKVPIWSRIELKDLRTDARFKILDFKGKKILLENFAVWCPICFEQQQIIREFSKKRRNFIFISLDIDPNEDKKAIRDYISRNGFGWKYAISSTEMTEALVDEFGSGIVSALSVPMILICEDGNFRKLSEGLKSVKKLEEEIDKGC